MTAQGHCKICDKVTSYYSTQLKMWKCDDCRGLTSKSQDEKFKEALEYSNKIEGIKHIKKNKSPFGKRYF